VLKNLAKFNEKNGKCIVKCNVLNKFEEIPKPNVVDCFGKFKKTLLWMYLMKSQTLLRMNNVIWNF